MAVDLGHDLLVDFDVEVGARLGDEFAEEAGMVELLLTDDAVDDPSDYATLLAVHGCAVDAWETTYVHRLSGTDPVLDWMRGTALTPVFDALDDDRRRALGELLELLRSAAES